MSNIFDDMTIEEQKAWWLEQAKFALERMQKSEAKVMWLSYTHRPVFDVRENDNHFILHMFLHQNYRWDQMYAVALWVKFLSAKAKLSMSIPVEGSMSGITAANSIGVEPRWNAILYHFIEGQTRNVNEVTKHELKKIGKFLAKMHSVSNKALNQQQSSSDIHSNYTLGFARSQLTKLDWEGLFSKTGIYYPGDENMTIFSDEQITVMDSVAEKVKSAMNILGKNNAEYGMIHGDFLLKNILFHENEVHALDFEYCGWGYYLYDLTPILWQLKPQAHYTQLKQALWNGYSSIRPLTERHRDLLETFIAGRQVASMRWIAANQQNPYVVGKVESILSQRTAELSAFLETGELKRE